MDKLEKAKEIEVDKKTSNIFFRISSDKKPYIFCKIDKKRFENLNPEVRIPLRNWLIKIPSEVESVILFGSSSRKEEKDGSDIDLAVILHDFKNPELQKAYEKEVKQKINNLTKKINAESNYPLKVIFITRDDFRNSKDHLILQSKETGFPIFGELNYYIKNEED